MRDTFLDRFERRLRDVLGLPADPDDDLFDGPDERGLYEYRPQSEAEMESSYRHYHEQPLAGHLLEEGFRQLRIANGYLHEPAKLKVRLGRQLRRRRLASGLASARLIVWKSWHGATPGETTHLDGYVLLVDSDERLALDIQALGEQQLWATEGWSDGSVMIRKPQERGVETIVCPVEALTPYVVDQAIVRWYMQRFEWKRGHWAVLERRLPRFEIDQSFWGWPDDPAEKARSEQHAARIDESLRALPLSEWAARMQRRFGVG